jgi:hypothetical protein
VHAAHDSALVLERDSVARTAKVARTASIATSPLHLAAAPGAGLHLARLDPAARASLVHGLQRGHGNAFVQRLARAAREDEHTHGPCACGGGGSAPCRCQEHRDEPGLQRQEAEPEEESAPPPWTELEGRGEPSDPTMEASSVAVKGLTHGNYDGGKYTTKSKVTKGKDCTDCPPKQCYTVTGTVESVFTASPKVELPKVSDFPDLTPCQQKRVKDAIDKKIAPHEQEHVKRFKTYSGTTSLPFEVTACKSELKDKAGAVVDKIHLDENKRRGDAADKLSAAIDPFVVNVDIDCKEPKK